jgi:hypothetical protein
MGFPVTAIASMSGVLEISPEATFQAGMPMRVKMSKASSEKGDDRKIRPASLACCASPAHCSGVNSMRFQ